MYVIRIFKINKLQTHNLLQIKISNRKPNQKISNCKSKSKASNQIQVLPCLLSPWPEKYAQLLYRHVLVDVSAMLNEFKWRSNNPRLPAPLPRIPMAHLVLPVVVEPVGGETEEGELQQQQCLPATRHHITHSSPFSS